ncbi:beta-ketoacyl-ACP synthase II [Methylomonas sp. 11b]|uniref:beta-ketoacyl-ACP synthase II n=1 Tax=Methylomonas sp. 11b TaxID=1168169 RepID=UPI00047CC2C0|nr:beta-ketoacyl-ACP synthase II [Methylomonas sp. 11b]
MKAYKTHHGLNGQRIVVTGMGIVSPLGCGVETTWNRLISGHSGVRKLCEDFTESLPVTVAGIVPTKDEDNEAGFYPDSVAPPNERRKMDRFILFALAAASEAILQAGWMPDDEYSRERTATIVGSGIGGFPAIANAVRTTDRRGVQRLSPFSIPSFIANMAASHVSIRYGYKGPLGAPVTACAAGVQAIGDAVRLIRCGEADVAICGGAEACIDLVSLGSFSAARALSTAFNHSLTTASRPFDSARDGFVMAEGAGMLVIETLDHALARGAKLIAEIIGYGTQADAYHMTSVPKDGEGAKRAMFTALQQAGLDANDIQHINAHATSTPVGDLGELAAIKTLFGNQESVAVTSTKSATGHLLGAAGGIEAIFTVLALRDQIVPATLNLDNPDVAAEGVDIVRGVARKMVIEHAMSNGFGFGGVNASVIFRHWSA